MKIAVAFFTLLSKLARQQQSAGQFCRHNEAKWFSYEFNFFQTFPTVHLMKTYFLFSILFLHLDGLSLVWEVKLEIVGRIRMLEKIYLHANAQKFYLLKIQLNLFEISNRVLKFENWIKIWNFFIPFENLFQIWTLRDGAMCMYSFYHAIYVWNKFSDRIKKIQV